MQLYSGKLFIISLSVVLAGCVLGGCSPSRSLKTYNLAGIYSAGGRAPRAEGIVVNVNDTLSRVYIKLGRPVSGLTESPGVTVYFVKYEIYNSYSEGVIADSASFSLSDSLFPDGAVAHHWDFRAATGSNCQVRIRVKSTASPEEGMMIIPCLKTSRRDANWLYFQDEEQQPVLRPYTGYPGPYRLLTGEKDNGSYTVSCYFNTFAPAAPPFVMQERPKFDYRADSTFSLSVNNGVSDFFSVPRQGFYFFQSDTAVFSGITLFRDYPGYPRINAPYRMIEAVRYITTNKEFEEMMHSRALKATIDSFWVAVSGNVERATEFLRSYYSRVEEANRLFFSFEEGWKTDRGMIYIVFGPPDIVYRNDRGEEWVYGEEGNMRSLRFYFAKAVNPFTENDYVLQRSETFKISWYNAVELWRR